MSLDDSPLELDLSFLDEIDEVMPEDLAGEENQDMNLVDFSEEDNPLQKNMEEEESIPTHNYLLD